MQQTPRRVRAPGRRRLRRCETRHLRIRMTIRVLLFASWADALGARSVDLDLADGATAADVLSALDARAGSQLPRPALAVNRCIVPSHARIARGDEVAIIPPVAGG